jgi:hypothetical protein
MKIIIVGLLTLVMSGWLKTYFGIYYNVLVEPFSLNDFVRDILVFLGLYYVIFQLYTTLLILQAKIFPRHKTDTK